jgi:hypothetical protein
VAAQGKDIVPLVGARRRERLTEALGALNVKLTPAHLADWPRRFRPAPRPARAIRKASSFTWTAKGRRPRPFVRGRELRNSPSRRKDDVMQGGRDARCLRHEQIAGTPLPALEHLGWIGSPGRLARCQTSSHQRLRVRRSREASTDEGHDSKKRCGGTTFPKSVLGRKQNRHRPDAGDGVCSRPRVRAPSDARLDRRLQAHRH